MMNRLRLFFRTWHMRRPAYYDGGCPHDPYTCSHCKDQP